MHLIEKEIDLWLNEAVNAGIIRDDSLILERIEEIKRPHVRFYGKSAYSENGVTYFLIRLNNSLLLVIFSDRDLPDGFSGRLKKFKKLKFLFCKLYHKKCCSAQKSRAVYVTVTCIK